MARLPPPERKHFFRKRSSNNRVVRRALAKKLFTLLDLCVSSLRRGHANLLCIVPILTDDPRRESNSTNGRNTTVLLEERLRKKCFLSGGGSRAKVDGKTGYHFHIFTQGRLKRRKKKRPTLRSFFMGSIWRFRKKIVGWGVTFSFRRWQPHQGRREDGISFSHFSPSYPKGYAAPGNVQCQCNM